jgi:hypothetical protein
MSKIPPQLRESFAMGAKSSGAFGFSHALSGKTRAVHGGGRLEKLR